MNYSVKERFLKYVTIDTEADPNSTSVPSSEKQKDLSKLIMQELDQLGITYTTNDAGYVYATLPSNIDRKVPTVFFCSHFDTAPDCSGHNVRPIVHPSYNGSPIVLPDDTSIIIETKDFPYLKKKIGTDIITASGRTLLGADDKSGVAIIMDAFYQLVQNPNIQHGEVKILFTTDEEIGKGVAQVDLDQLGADFGYTLDGGELGSIEAENFSADSATLQITGVSAHPCCAKGKMEHAIKIAADILHNLPKDTLSPETTEGYEGFIHPNKIEGTLESAKVNFIIRDFVTENLDKHVDIIRMTADAVLKAYPNSSYTLTTKKQYRNMKDVIDKNPQVLEVALQAMKNVGITPNLTNIRGGTDGAVLSHMGKPCPNIFTGMQAIHSKKEWISVHDMERAVDTVIEICRLIGTEHKAS